MLSMEVTDGQLIMKAVEYGPLSALSLLTCPGCKVDFLIADYRLQKSILVVARFWLSYVLFSQMFVGDIILLLK